MHEESAVIFECGKCKQSFKTKNTLKNHEKNCKTSHPPTEKTKKICVICNKTTTKSNFARHWKTCNERRNIESHGTKNNEIGISETEIQKLEPRKYKPAYQYGQTPKILQTQPIDHGEEGIPFMRVNASHGHGHGGNYSEKR